ncbi:hypothetical protein AB6D11_00520 [Vibrio splendidus]
MKKQIGLDRSHHHLIVINICIMVSAIVCPPMLCLSILVLILIQDSPQCPSFAITERQIHWLVWGLCMLCAIILASSVYQYVMAIATVILILRLLAITHLNTK